MKRLITVEEHYHSEAIEEKIRRLCKAENLKFGNADGLYSFADLKQRFQKAILAYDDLPNDAESEAA